MKKKTIILVTERNLFPLNNYGGNAVRILTLLKALKSFGYHVVFITAKSKENFLNKKKLKKIVDKLIFVNFKEFSQGHLKNFDVSSFYDTVETVVSKFNPVAVIVEYIWMAPCLDRVYNGAIKIIDTHDLMHIRKLTHSKKNVHPWVICSKKEECNLLIKADVIIAIQKNEAKKIKELVPRKKVICVMHSPEIEGKLKKLKNNPKKDIIMVVGSFNYDNIHGINEFLTDAWPFIKKNCHNAELHIYGFLVEAVKKDIEGVKKIGFVENLEKAYGQAKIVINPTLVGTGLKIKTVEALCYGKALVTTSFGADGLEKGIGKAFVVEKDMRKLGRAVVKLLQDDSKRESLEKNAFEFAKNIFSKENVFKELLDILKNK